MRILVAKRDCWPSRHSTLLILIGLSGTVSFAVFQKNILETENHRILVEDTDEGEVLRERVHDLKQLVAAYQLGWITETRCEDHIW